MTILTLPPTPTLTTLISTLRSATTPPQTMQTTIQTLTHTLITTAKAHDPTLTNPTLIPILRGALPMYVTAQTLFPTSSCILTRAHKKKGTQQVHVDWLGRRPGAEDGRVVVLDTVVATGDTVVRMCEELEEMGRGVVVVCCYAAPEALVRIAGCSGVEFVVVGVRAERCDENGYLVPGTHGDIGDRIFGAVEGRAVVVGEDGGGVLEGLGGLLAGGWALSGDGLGVERVFRFEGFRGAWEFMQRVAEAAVVYRHHPEWSNVYDTVSIRWTTHRPKGLTPLDVQMARLCDSYYEG
ncbi:hypothetical protein BDV28DRAFT_133383 [Aspergillus coremiiformis]|uniref:4a-hydroxytetrahydrobiopterin dehydratase n=1 Tax=Aspergillus coremiiformis TaxID=138285 RepID=A0A5N6Z7B2_9EURO|nr:hypothetical protein BDV28DRAFT_133383 [Aspergillus coremiiformis]